VLFSDKYQLIGKLIGDCSCHSNVNSAAAAATAGDVGGDGSTRGNEGITTAAAPSSASSSGLCILV